MCASKFNAEGYYDPTAYEAMKMIEKDEKKHNRYRPLVYVCSPLSGDIEGNQAKARDYCRFVISRGGIPIAPHLLFPQFMSDGNKEERELALFMDLVILSKCRELWVFGERISKGMGMEIDSARNRNQTIRYFTSDLKEAGV